VTRLVSAALSASISIAFVRSAHAYERQWRAGVDGGYATLFGEPSAGGYGGGVHLGYGLTDSFNALLEIDGTRHPEAGASGMTLWSAGAGLAYTFDVAKLVPYAGLLGAGYRIVGDVNCVTREDGRTACAPYANAPGLQIVLGLDYNFDKNWAIGAQLRMHTIFAPEPMGVLAYETTFVRAEYVWGN
jgi:hypothetical protein